MTETPILPGLKHWSRSIFNLEKVGVFGGFVEKDGVVAVEATGRTAHRKKRFLNSGLEEVGTSCEIAVEENSGPDIFMQAQTIRGQDHGKIIVSVETLHNGFTGPERLLQGVDPVVEFLVLERVSIGRSKETARVSTCAAVER